jgi:hypothetical protein
MTERAPDSRYAAAFVEWERRYREEPGRFLADWARVDLEVDDYGQRAAAYFATLLAEDSRTPEAAQNLLQVMHLENAVGELCATRDVLQQRLAEADQRAALLRRQADDLARQLEELTEDSERMRGICGCVCHDEHRPVDKLTALLREAIDGWRRAEEALCDEACGFPPDRIDEIEQAAGLPTPLPTATSDIERTQQP